MSTDIIMLVIFIVVMVIDIWLVADDIPGNTFSQRLYLWARKKPSVPLFFGFLMGHWFG